MHSLSTLIFTLVAGFSATASAATVTFKFYDSGDCQGNIQDGPIQWSDTQGIHNVVLVDAARNGAASADVECDNDGTGDNFDCITAYYGGQYGTKFLGTHYGLGCVGNFSEYIQSAGFFVPGAPLSKRSIDEIAPRDPAEAEGFLARRQEDSDPHQRGIYDFDPTYQVQWDPAPGTCPATTLEVDNALTAISEQFRYDDHIGQSGTILHSADVYEDWNGPARHTLDAEYTLFRGTSYHEAGIWHSILDSTFSRLYRNGGTNHLGAITLFLYVGGVHVGSAVYNIRQNR